MRARPAADPEQLQARKLGQDLRKSANKFARWVRLHDPRLLGIHFREVMREDCECGTHGRRWLITKWLPHAPGERIGFIYNSDPLCVLCALNFVRSQHQALDNLETQCEVETNPA